jgi:L-fuconate dehydratase
MKISAIRVHDVRFPTSKHRHGSDAMNPDPDYSCAYVELLTDQGGPTGRGLTFTIGRGTQLCVAAIEALSPMIIGTDVDAFENDWSLVTRRLGADSQLRWLGPEKGVIHLATAAIVNAVWDLLAKRAGVPLWRLLSEADPAKIVEAVDFRHISNYLPREAALERLQDQVKGRATRIAELEADGYPAYTTSAGWLGYSDTDIRARLTQAWAEGWRHFKLKVGADLDDDRRRCALFREVLGPEARLSIDANQVWEQDQAIDWVNALAQFDIYWIEEPTSPDDILAHAAIRRAVAPIGVATGEHAHNRVMFKQLLQAEAIDFCQIDACRLAGVNEVVAVLLMADKARVPVCPHAGGVGLCEYVQHLSMFDYAAVSGEMSGRVIEHAGQLHHHFANPIQVVGGRYRVPQVPGYSADFAPDVLERYAYPHGKVWRESAA